MTKKRRREMELVRELQRDHGYIFAKLTQRRERRTTQVRGLRTSSMTFESAVAVRLIVPEGSFLGAQIDAMYKADAVPARKKKGR